MGLDSAEAWVRRVREKPVTIDLVEGLLPAEPSISLLSAATGEGKTNLALQLAFCVATGTDFLNSKTKKARVGYIGVEGTETNMAERLEKLFRQFPSTEETLKFGLLPAMPLEGNEGAFKEHLGDVDLIILDPLKYLVRGDYVKPANATRFLQHLQVFMENMNAPIVLCHHVRKRDPRYLVSPDDLYQLKGAGDYTDAATTVILVERKKQGRSTNGKFAARDTDAFTLYFPKTRNAVAAVDPVTMRFDREKMLFVPRSIQPDLDF
jgi:RecA-family ATPase